MVRDGREAKAFYPATLPLPATSPLPDCACSLPLSAFTCAIHSAQTRTGRTHHLPTLCSPFKTSPRCHLSWDPFPKHESEPVLWGVGQQEGRLGGWQGSPCAKSLKERSGPRERETKKSQGGYLLPTFVLKYGGRTRVNSYWEGVSWAS